MWASITVTVNVISLKYAQRVNLTKSNNREHKMLIAIPPRSNFFPYVRFELNGQSKVK